MDPLTNTEFRKKADKLYIYLDESGDLGQHGSKYFNIAAICTHEPNELKRCIKRVRTRKLKKKLKDCAEIKANNSDPTIRRRVLGDMAKTNCDINIITVNKEKVFSYLYKKKEKLYNYIAGLLLDRIDFKKHNVEIIIDKKYHNSVLRDEFNSYIKNKLKERKFNRNVNVYHLYSYEDQGLQATDFVAWSANRKFSFDDDSYYKIIEKKITKQINLWQEEEVTDPMSS